MPSLVGSEMCIRDSQSLDRMLAVRFEVPEEAVEQRRTLRVRITDVDGAVSEIGEQRR